MSVSIISPFQIFLDSDGNPIEDGYVYVGGVNLNPETNPVTVYWDRAQTIVAPNPIRTKGGYPSRSGTPASIFSAGSYSITVKDKNGVLVFHSPANSDDGAGDTTSVVKNYVQNSSFEDGTTTGWNLGRDTGTTTPLTGGTGGGATEFLPLTLDSTTPLAGNNSLSINKPTGNIQGSTLYSDNITIDREDTLSAMYIGFSFKSPVAGYASGDYSVFLWDVTGGALVALSTNAMVNTAGGYAKFFAGLTSTANRTYRIIIMCTNASNLATFETLVDSVFFGATTANAERLGGSTLIELKRWAKENARPIGEMVHSEVKLTPVVWAGDPATYLPLIDRNAADVNVTSTQAPDLVTAYRAYIANVLGTTSFTGTVAGSVITFTNTTTNNALLAALEQDALVSRWISSSQSATYAGSGGDYSNGRSINVAGTDYAITALSTGSRTITVSGSPTTGSQTVILYPYRIAGSTTSVRLHRLSGFVPVSSGDSDGELIGGLRRMDRGQGHKHDLTVRDAGGYIVGSFVAWGAPSGGSNVTAGTGTSSPTTDGTNGTPRTGKTNDARSHANFFYTFPGQLLA